VDNAPPRLNPGALDFQQLRRLMKEFSQVIVLALNRAKVDRKGGHSPFATPRGINDYLPPSGLGAYVLGGDPVDPGFRRLFDTLTVIAYEPQHMELESQAGQSVV